MAQNIRTFYACQAVAVQRLIPDGAGDWTPDGNYEFVHGVQSVGLNTSFDIENVFELGQIEIYDSVLQVPSVEITLEKVLDDHTTPYLIIGAGQGLLDASKNRANVQFAIYKDTENAGESAPLLTLLCTGLYVSNVSYTLPSDGNCTESTTLVGNHKQWGGGFSATIPSEISDQDPDIVDEPANGIVLTRKDVTVMTVPNGDSKVQSITLSVDLGREDLFELGRKSPYAKVPNYPVEVTAEIEYLADDDTTEQVSFDENTNELPVKDQTISVTVGSYTIDLGAKCFLNSVTYGGGDATGGNATSTYSYATYNTFTVSQ